MRRRAASLTCLTLTAALAAVPAHAAPCGRAAAARLGWWFVSTPQFPPKPPIRQMVSSGNDPIRAVAVDPADPRVLFVTNGRALLRSNDGGCSWRTVFTLPAVTSAGGGPDGDVGAITSIDVARVNGRPRVLLAVDTVDSPFVRSRTVVLRSDDGYGGWSAGDSAGLAGHAFPLMMSASQPIVHSAGAVAYVAGPALNRGMGYWRSVDHGRTWALRSSLTDPSTPAWINGFAVNPWDPDELWEWGGDVSIAEEELTGLRFSKDGGATWTAVDAWPGYEPDPAWVSVEVAWPRRGAPPRLVVLGSLTDAQSGAELPVVNWSGDGARTFTTVLPPRDFDMYMTVATHLPNGDLVLLSNERWTYRVRHRGRPPQKADWVGLSRPPIGVSWMTIGHDPARASATVPTTVVVPTAYTVQLLTVNK